MLRLHRLQFDGDFLSRDNVGAQINVAERTRADLSTDSVFVADAEILLSIISTSLSSDSSPSGCPKAIHLKSVVVHHTMVVILKNKNLESFCS